VGEHKDRETAADNQQCPSQLHLNGVQLILVFSPEIRQNKTNQNKSERIRTKQNKAEQIRTKQNEAEQSRTNQNKAERSRTKQNKSEQA
jgi:hypothetical protein